MQLRTVILSDASRFVSDNIIDIGSCSAKASDIAESFDDGQMTDGAFIDAFIKCMLSDEEMYSPQSVGDRIFLPMSIVYALSCDYIKHYGKPPSFSAKNLVEMLREVIPSFDLAATKFTQYCVNQNHSRVDVLYLNNYLALQSKFRDHHKDLGRHIMKRLSDGLHEVSKRSIDRFRHYRNVQVPCPAMTNPNDYAFFVMRYMELYDGDTSPLLNTIQLEKSKKLRSQMLYYLIFHRCNTVRLLEDIEAFRPVAEETAPDQA
ncbi:hypothetical protein E2562_020021 [Oryza meyeriana var. granulata]|uniref:Ubiquitin-like protease family profile domain-containing protein n=1 Tax=Oryza meyeriana var. granulata TaxID=110450 RepID=A0A6G1FAD1_9ORYZ|nr:hypothetical protein E2562_020021 [Oryza meyeriana var. granulata]